MGQIEAAMLAEQIEADAWGEFLSSLGRGMGREEAEKARADATRELPARISEMLTSRDTQRVVDLAVWVTQNAGAIALRWSIVRRTYERWIELHAVRPVPAVGTREEL
jgi:hypothetical protein